MKRRARRLDTAVAVGGLELLPMPRNQGGLPQKPRTTKARSEVYADGASGERIRSGQRGLIFATASRIGLRPEQLYDLVEGVLERRTSPPPESRMRAIAELSIGEARYVTGVLKKLERNQAAVALDRVAGRPSTATDHEIRMAARRAADLVRARQRQLRTPHPA